MPLFDRVKGKIYLNESGTIFVRSLDQMFDALNAGLTEIRSSAQFQQYQVYVASNADSLLFHVSEEFFAGHSDTNIKYSVMSPEQIRDGFQHGKLDLALTTYPLIEPGIEWEQVLEEELVLVLGPEHPLAGHKEISFAELKGVEIMCESLGGDLRTMVDRVLCQGGISRQCSTGKRHRFRHWLPRGAAPGSHLYAGPPLYANLPGHTVGQRAALPSAHRRPPAGPGPNADHGGGP